MNRNKTIDYIEFQADDLAATRQFYSQVFGWDFEDYGPDYTSFKDGRIGGGFSRGTVNAGAGPLVVIFVDDLPSVEKQIIDAGGRITRETFSFPGGSRFHFCDPSGNHLLSGATPYPCHKITNTKPSAPNCGFLTPCHVKPSK